MTDNELVARGEQSGLSPSAAFKAMKSAAAGEHSLACAIWMGFREARLPVERSSAFWAAMSAAPEAYTAAELAQFFERVSEVPDLELAGMGRVAPRAWRPEFDRLLEPVLHAPEPLVSGRHRLKEPMRSGLVYGLAKHRLVDVRELPDGLLEAMAALYVRSDPTTRDEIIRLGVPWSDTEIGNAIAALLLQAERPSTHDIHYVKSADLDRRLRLAESYPTFLAAKILDGPPLTELLMRRAKLFLTAPANSSEVDQLLLHLAARTEGRLPEEFYPLVPQALADPSNYEGEILSAIPESLREEFVLQLPRSSRRSRVMARYLSPRLEAELVKELQEEDIPLEDLHPHGVRLALAALQTAKRPAALIRGLEEMDTQSSRAALVSVLHSKKKKVRQSAAASLANFGETVLELLGREATPAVALEVLKLFEPTSERAVLARRLVQNADATIASELEALANAQSLPGAYRTFWARNMGVHKLKPWGKFLCGGELQVGEFVGDAARFRAEPGEWKVFTRGDDPGCPDEMVVCHQSIVTELEQRIPATAQIWAIPVEGGSAFVMDAEKLSSPTVQKDLEAGHAGDGGALFGLGGDGLTPIFVDNPAHVRLVVLRTRWPQMQEDLPRPA